MERNIVKFLEENSLGHLVNRMLEGEEQASVAAFLAIPNLMRLMTTINLPRKKLWKPSREEVRAAFIAKVSSIFLKGAVCLYLVQLATHVAAVTRFASHVSVNTPARSFTHGVGDPLPEFGRRTSPRQVGFTSFRHPSATSSRGGGYPRVRPTIPFNSEDLPRASSGASPPWQSNRNQYAGIPTIPLLPPSPYKVDSPDPESLWPEGLFLPPISPPNFLAFSRRKDADADLEDPYLLEGSEAIAAVARAKDHGELYFHDIPHIESLLENQELRLKNNLKPHVLGSIRHTWQFYRV